MTYFISLFRRNKNLSDCSIVTLCLNMGFTETRLHDGIVSLYMLDNFNMFENSSDPRGGGVAIYANCKYRVSKINVLPL